MPKCTIDGKELEFKPGETIIQCASRNNTEIPVFCYHPGMSVVAQCRMCVVEVEKMPKLQTACSTPLAEGMVVHTKSPKVKDQQEAVMEFLLINHPLDCPVCDKAGECDLQDNSFKYGDGYSRYTEERRTYLDLDMGPVIKKNMNRCIHCTRCIRFGEEIAHKHEMVAVQRGNNTEITTIDGRPLETDYAGNYADICPTGSLTLKDFRFKKRAWYLKKTDSVCEGCSRGCNIVIFQDNNVVYRLTPRENMAVNKYWMCDDGRFSFHTINDEDRYSKLPGSWSAAIASARNALHGKNPLIMVGTDLTLEEMKTVQDFAQKFSSGAEIVHFGTPGIKTSADDADEDKILKRKSKTSNLHGAEKLGIKPFTSAAGKSAVLVITGGRAVVPAEIKDIAVKVGLGVFTKRAAKEYTVILPGLTFAEKDGTVLNSQGMEQRFKRAILPVGHSKSTPEILMMLMNSTGHASVTSMASAEGVR